MEALVEVGDGKDDHEIGLRSVRNERLRAVDDETVPIGNSSRPQRESVRTRSRLGHRMNTDQRPIAQTRQIFALLAFASELPQRNNARQQMRA